MPLARGRSVEVAMADDDHGIMADFLPHVFEPFRQADAAGLSARRGLGLAVARKLVEIHGGEISAHSGGEGFGATFSVRLPLEERVRFKTLTAVPHRVGRGFINSEREREKS